MGAHKKGINSFVVKKNVAYIFLSRGKRTVIDRDDLERVLNYRWYARKDHETFYAYGSADAGYLHRLLTNNEFKKVDHKDRDGLDNRRSNFRNVTESQSLQNRGVFKRKLGFKGVYFHDNKFEAKARIDGKVKYLGFFHTAEEAAHARDNFVKKSLHCGSIFKLSLAIEDLA